MSKLKVKTVKLGDSVTESNNYQIKVPASPNGTMTIETADGTSVADFTGKNVAWTGSQRQLPLNITSLSVDLAQRNYFVATISAGGTLTFTNIATTIGQSGFIKFVIGGAYSISAHTNTKISAANLAKMQVAGTYIGSYFNDGTDVWIQFGTYS